MASTALLKRIMMIGVITLTAAVGIYAAGRTNLFYALLTDQTSARRLSAPEAYEKAQAGDILLIDIRRPDEWVRTGSGEGAVRLDMRRKDFTDALERLVQGDKTRAIALICARGVRSARLNNRLIKAGFNNTSDVSEGMLGSAAGPGWIKRGLPVTTYSAGN